VEEIKDKDAPRRKIRDSETASHSCLKSTKVEPPKSTRRATTVEVVDDEDTLKERKGLNRTLPVLMDPADSSTIDNIEDIVE
jgi:hypothetical protein